MSAPVAEFFASFSTYMPWVSFITGLGGGLHCVGMCGGLVTASCSGGEDVVRYQLGRLAGYLLLGALAGFAGESLRLLTAGPWPAFFGGLSLGALFIYWGIESWRGKRGEIPLPKFLARFYGRLWRMSPQRDWRSAWIGLISIFLPCGLLYGVVLAAVALQDPVSAITGMAFFWLGTLPSMVLAPQLLRRVLRPLQLRAPRVFGVVLLLIGLATIGQRLFAVSSVRAHSPSPLGTEATVGPHRCH